jgi:hypothetical protein
VREEEAAGERGAEGERVGVPVAHSSGGAAQPHSPAHRQQRVHRGDAHSSERLADRAVAVTGLHNRLCSVSSTARASRNPPDGPDRSGILPATTRLRCRGCKQRVEAPTAEIRALAAACSKPSCCCSTLRRLSPKRHNLVSTRNSSVRIDVQRQQRERFAGPTPRLG